MKNQINKIKKIVVVAEQVVLYTAIVAGVGFYLGTQFQAKQNAKIQATVHDAVQAQTAVAAIPKN